MRLTSAVPDDDPGGPVIDAHGRIVGVAFATDPPTLRVRHRATAKRPGDAPGRNQASLPRP
jgi:hypothetical protein